MDIHVSLTEELADFVKSKVASGRYRSSSEVIEDALRLLEGQDREAQNLHDLKEAWNEGLKSGDYRPLDLDAIKTAGRRKLTGNS